MDNFSREGLNLQLQQPKTVRPERTTKKSSPLGPPNVLKFGMAEESVVTRELEPISTLGAGAYGNVELFRYEDNTIAIKRSNGGNDDDLRNEILANKKVGNSEFIVEYIGYVLFEENRIGMCMEVMEGPIARLVEMALRLDQPIPERVIAVAAYSILNALDRMATKGIIHRDVCCFNVLVNSCGYIKLADLGVAAETFYSTTLSIRAKRTYQTPEAQAAIMDRHCTTKGDVWCMGLVLRHLATREVHSYEVFASSDCRTYMLDDEKLPNQPELCSFINACLSTARDARAGYHELRNTPYFAHCESPEVLEDGRCSIQNMFAFDQLHTPFNKLHLLPVNGAATEMRLSVPKECTHLTFVADGVYNATWSLGSIGRTEDRTIVTRSLKDEMEHTSSYFEMTALAKLQKLEHPNIIEFLGSFTEWEWDEFTSFSLILQSVDCTLADSEFYNSYCEEIEPGSHSITERLFFSISQQILLALDFIHNSGIVHGNISAKCFGIQENSRPGIAVKLLNFGDVKSFMISKAEDVWQAGSILLNIVGTHDVIDANLAHASIEILAALNIEGIVGGQITHEYITGPMQRRPEHRIMTIRDIAGLARELLNKLMAEDENRRATASTALALPYFTTAGLNPRTPIAEVIDINEKLKTEQQKKFIYDRINWKP